MKQFECYTGGPFGHDDDLRKFLGSHGKCKLTK
jgi:hypothetical protein